MPVAARPGVLSLTIKDKNALYAAYMPFVKGGGIFVPSNRPYKLGEEVFMLLTLMDSKEKIPVAGHVVWVTPSGRAGQPHRRYRHPVQREGFRHCAPQDRRHPGRSTQFRPAHAHDVT